jgi:hypothetical protein
MKKAELKKLATEMIKDYENLIKELKFQYKPNQIISWKDIEDKSTLFSSRCKVCVKFSNSSCIFNYNKSRWTDSGPANCARQSTYPVKKTITHFRIRKNKWQDFKCLLDNLAPKSFKNSNFEDIQKLAHKIFNPLESCVE